MALLCEPSVFFSFYLLPSLPPSQFFYICFLQECAEVTHGPWNLEFGSPPSTLSLHLRLKSESEDKYSHTHAPSVQSRPGSPPGGGVGGGDWAFGKEQILPGLHWVPNWGAQEMDPGSCIAGEKGPPHPSQGLALVPDTGGVPSCEGQISICKMEGLHELGNCLTEPCIFHDLWRPSYL